MKQIKLALLIILLAVLCKSSFAQDSTMTLHCPCPEDSIGCDCPKKDPDFAAIGDNQNSGVDFLILIKSIKNDDSRKRISLFLDTLMDYQISIVESINLLKSKLLYINSDSVKALQKNLTEYFNQINVYQNEITRLEIIQNRNSISIDKLQVLLLNYLYKNSDSEDIK